MKLEPHTDPKLKGLIIECGYCGDIREYDADELQLIPHENAEEMDSYYDYVSINFNCLSCDKNQTLEV